MKKIIFLISSAFLMGACASKPPQAHCENADLAYAAHMPSPEKRYEAFNKRCESAYGKSVDKNIFLKNYESSRQKYLSDLCTCESGFIYTAVHYDEARGKTISGASALQLSAKVDECKAVNKEAEYLRGIDLARVKQKEADRKRKFTDRVWNGSTVLTKEDAHEACGG